MSSRSYSGNAREICRNNIKRPESVGDVRAKATAAPRIHQVGVYHSRSNRARQQLREDRTKSQQRKGTNQLLSNPRSFPQLHEESRRQHHAPKRHERKARRSVMWEILTRLPGAHVLVPSDLRKVARPLEERRGERHCPRSSTRC